MEEKKLVPKRRFRGFGEKWSQRKFNELIVRISTTEKDISLPQVEFEDIISEEGRINKDIFQKKIDKTGIKFKEDDILFGKLRPYLKNWLLANFEGLAIGDFWVFRSKTSDSKFIYFLIQTQRYQSIANLTIGTKMPRSDWYTVSNTNFNVPINKEQQKIGEFFKVSDERIANQERKVAKIKALKAAYLTEMFPQEGETVPKRRFKGFEGEWKSVGLGEISETFDYGLNVEAKEYDGINKYIRITDIDDESRLFIKSDLTSPKIDFNVSGDYILREGDILFARTGASVGKTYRYRKQDGKVYYAGFLIKTRIKEEYDYEFVFQSTLTDSYKRFVNITSQRSGQPGVNAYEYSTFKLLLPELEEQQKIGEFFKNLDDQIEMEKKKLDKLQKMKEAYLEEMFV